MIGSKKQIAWAEDIKSAKASEFFAFESRAKNEAATKIINFIQSQEDARFWISYKGYSAQMMLMSILKEGLRIKGYEFSHLAKATQDGTITISWKEILADGKGGYEETKTKTL